MKTFKYLFIFLLVLNIFWNISLYFLPDRTTVFNFLFNGVSASIQLLTVGLCFFAAKKVNKTFLYFGLGVLYYWAGLMVWMIFNLVLKTDVPYPGWPDVCFVGSYILQIVALTQIIIRTGFKFTIGKIIEIAIITALVFVMMYLFLHSDQPSVSFSFSVFLNLLYPLLDAVQISLAIVGFRSDAGVFRTELLVFSIAFVLMALADTFFAYRIANNIYWNGDLSDTIFTGAFACLFVALYLTISPGQKDTLISNMPESEKTTLKL